MKVNKQTIWNSLKVTAFVFCTLWWGGLNCLASCVAGELAKVSGACEMDCCAVQESEKSLDEKTTGLAASLPGFDCCALQDLAAQETSQPKHIVPDVTVFVPVMAAFFPPQIITSEPYFPSLSLPDKSNLRMLNCVWRI